MKVLVDTSVWSLALRRSSGSLHPARAELESLVKDGRAAIIGPIRQEILSGIKSADQYEMLKQHLRAFPDVELTTEDYEEAERLFNLCRSKGVQGSNTDFLICSAARGHGMAIFTTDRDFDSFADVIPIDLYQRA